MFHTGRDEEDVAYTERMLLVSVDEGTAALGHDVEFVPGMGGLLVSPPRGVVFHHHSPVRQDLDGALALRDGERRGSLDRRPPPLDLRIRFVQRSSSSLFVLTTRSDVPRSPTVMLVGVDCTGASFDEPAHWRHTTVFGSSLAAKDSAQ